MVGSYSCKVSLHRGVAQSSKKKRELTVIRKFRLWLTNRILFAVVAGVVSRFEFSGDLTFAVDRSEAGTFEFSGP